MTDPKTLVVEVKAVINAAKINSEAYQLLATLFPGVLPPNKSVEMIEAGDYDYNDDEVSDIAIRDKANPQKVMLSLNKNKRSLVLSSDYTWEVIDDLLIPTRKY